MPRKPSRIEQLATELRQLSEALASEEADALSMRGAKSVRQTITETCDRLRDVIEDLDPIHHPGFVFDLSNPNVVGRIVGITMIAQPRKRLADFERFYGSGVYAIYYNGAFPTYAGISRREHPVYIGKADPEDPYSKGVVQQGDRLSNRLNDHRRSISKAATTLRLEDFEFRALAVQSGWQTAAEAYLIDLFKPIWNSEVKICYGIGKHGDNPETRANLRSPWDTLHPGREWAHRDPKMTDARSERRIHQDIEQHLLKHPPFGSIDEILRLFLEEIRAVS